MQYYFVKASNQCKEDGNPRGGRIFDKNVFSPYITFLMYVPRGKANAARMAKYSTYCNIVCAIGFTLFSSIALRLYKDH